ncbi:MAG: flagellar export protein FliJ [Clostridia bacterium]|nr:flagellar export protein FliJ [Clostridia bacterium]MDH7573455.1 flagellar export protein FliJ [Clostridia bacterium]
MARFRFSLESVLSYRRFREEQELRRLAEGYRRERRAEAQLAAWRGELARRQEEAGGSGADLGERLHTAVYLEFLAGRVRRQREELEGLRREVRELEGCAARASQERRALERLRDHRREQWQYEEGRCSQREADEMVLLRYGGSRWEEGGEEY